MGAIGVAKALARAWAARDFATGCAEAKGLDPHIKWRFKDLAQYACREIERLRREAAKYKKSR